MYNQLLEVNYLNLFKKKLLSKCLTVFLLLFFVSGCCHIVTKNIDTGPIIYSQKLKYPYPRNYNLFRKKVYDLEAEVLIKGVSQILKNKKKFKIQKKNQGNFYKPMSKKLLNKVKIILKNRSFKH